MRMENSSYETSRENLSLATAVGPDGAGLTGVRIEACEFERLLRRAMEVLSVRERSALVERSRLTNAADSAVQ
jgi:hypothetical protein